MKLVEKLFTGIYLGFLAFLILALLDSLARAEENWFIQVDELSINYKQYQASSRNPLFYNSIMKEGIDLTMNNDLGFGLLFWDNTIHSATNSGQYYLIGWQFKLGVRVTQFLSVQYEHHSQHVLDEPYPYMKFPVEDSIGFTLRIIGNGPRGEAMF